MTELKEIQEYCKGKSIAIVGNGSKLLKANYAGLIEAHDVIVRMNFAVPVDPKFYKNIGRRTDIYVVGIQRSNIVHQLIKGQSFKFLIRPTPWGENVRHESVYTIENSDYTELKRQFDSYKPSTGSIALYLFDKYIDYKKITLFGFDFFKSANTKKNEFKSFRYRDHDPAYEQKYIFPKLGERIKIIR